MPHAFRPGRPIWPTLAPILAASLGAAILAAFWMPYLPNKAGQIGVDYSIWLPYLLAGDFWHWQNPWWAIPWFNPSLCGGVPLNADPQGSYISLPQFLSFALGPLRAIQISFFAFALAGFAGTYALARARFRLSLQASLLAALLFMLNNFYAARMMVGHLSFSPFMLLPAMVVCLAGAPSIRLSAGIFRCFCFAILLAATIQGGMAVLLLPAYLCLAITLVLLALATGEALRTPFLRLCCGTALGLCLCAGKIAASLALMHQIPRDAYPLPGFSNIAVAAWMGFRSVFLLADSDMMGWIHNSKLLLELHEFSYGVGPAPLVLLVAATVLVWRHPILTLPQHNRIYLYGLILLLLVPAALNSYGPGWSALLKTLPVLRNSTSLLRWFAAYILPAALAGAIALDRLAPDESWQRWALAGGGLALTLACLLAYNRPFYDAESLGTYDPQRIEASFRAVSRTRHVPQITIEAVLRNHDGTLNNSLTRQDMLTIGGSSLLCYDALFGYQLEFLKFGTLHPGSVFDEIPTPTGPRLNLKNPACYVFPGANRCSPGDEFLASDRKQLEDFSAYKAFVWHKPWWAEAADWLGIATAILTLALFCGFALAQLRRAT